MAKTNKKYKEFKLDNGLQVAIQNTPTKTVSGRLDVWHGALNEIEGEEGIAHFLEHSLMRGSKKYSSKESNKIWSNFGFFDAATSLEKTFFSVDMLSEDSKLFLEYISDTVFNPLFEESKIEEERQRVLRETVERTNFPSFNDVQKYWETFFGKNSPHTRSPLGKEEVVRSADLNMLKEFHKRGYLPNNMNLIMVGGLPKNIESLIQENFGKFSPGKQSKIEISKNTPLEESTILHTYAPELYDLQKPERSSAELRMALFGPTSNEEDSYATQILIGILGGEGGDSRLFQSLSQKKGLTYGIGARYCGSNNSGVIHVQGKIHSARLNEGINTIFEQMALLRENLVSEETLKMLQRKASYHSEKMFESNAGKIDAIGLNLYYGVTSQDYLERIKSVTPEKVREAARKYLPKNRTEGKYVLSLRDPLKK